MLSEDPGPEPAMITSRVNRSSADLTPLLAETMQTRPGSDEPPIQPNFRGSASMFILPMTAWLAMLREKEPKTVPSFGALF